MEHKLENSRYGQIDWTLSKVKLFIETLMKITLSKDVTELKHLFILECIWMKMEEELDIDHKTLKYFWNYRLHAQLFSCQAIYVNEIKIKLIEYIHGKGLTELAQLKWHKIISMFDGINKEFLYKIFNHLIAQAKILSDHSKFPELIEVLYLHVRPNLINKPEDKILPRIVYSKNKIFYNKDDMEKVEDYLKTKLNESDQDI